MSLQIWLPLNGNLENQGLNSSVFTSSAIYDNDGKIGKCLSSDIVLSVQNNLISKITLKNQYSFALWMKNKNYSGWAFRFGDVNGDTASNGRGMWINLNGYYEFAYQNSGTNIALASTICDNNWHHIVYAVNDKSAIIYVDGKLVKNLTLSYNQQLNYEYIQLNGSTNYINDFRIYDHCLSAKEVKELAKGLVLHYRLAGPGQANLLTGTGSNDSGWNVNQSGATVTRTVTSDCTTFNVTATTTSWFLYYHALPTSVRNSLKVNTIYTYSFEVKSNKNFYLGISLLSGNGLSPMSNNKGITILGDNKWHKYSVQLTTIADFSTLTQNDQYFYMNGGNIISTVSFRNAKLEEGSIATPWCPNSADALYSAMGYNNNIEYDCSGYRRNGIKKSNIVWDINSARYTTSYKFDGSTAGIEVTATGLGNIMNNPCTISFWLYSNDKGGRSIYFSSYNSNPFWCIEKTTDERFRYDWNGTIDKYSTGVTIPDKKWTHICLVREGISLAKLYLNGELKYSFTDTTSSLSLGDTWRIGRDVRTGDGTPLNGNMSDFRIYATALSAEDIAELYHSAVIVDNTGKNYAYEYFETN